MLKSKHTQVGAVMTELVLETFKLNGRLLAVGDKLVKPLGLSSARWQILGAIHFAETPQPVAQLARSMGLTRQGVQRIANELEKDGLVSFQPNPNHKRAQLVVMTDEGKSAYASADQNQVRWVNDLSHGFEAEEIKCALRVMETMRSKIEKNLNEQ